MTNHKPKSIHRLVMNKVFNVGDTVADLVLASEYVLIPGTRSQYKKQPLPGNILVGRVGHVVEVDASRVRVLWTHAKQSNGIFKGTGHRTWINPSRISSFSF